MRSTDKPLAYVLLTFDFEEWRGMQFVTKFYNTGLYEKTERIVDLLKESEVPATVFMDAQTTLMHPEAARLLADAGLELALHSDYHWHAADSHRSDLDFSVQDSKTQVQRMRSAISMIRRVIPGFKPLGFRAPGLKWNESLYVSLSKLKFLYDSSQEDKYIFQPLLKNGIVVLPMNSEDFDSACFRMNGNYVVRVWVDQFEKACSVAAEEGESYFLLLLHPSVSGRREYIGMLKAILGYLGGREEVIEYSTCLDLATRYSVLLGQKRRAMSRIETE